MHRVIFAGVSAKQMGTGWFVGNIFAQLVTTAALHSDLAKCVLPPVFQSFLLALFTRLTFRKLMNTIFIHVRGWLWIE